MKIVLVAQDIAPSNAFELLAAELKSRGHEPSLLVGKGKVFPVSLEDVRQAVKDSHIVVSGMSSSVELAAPEIAACDEALKHFQTNGAPRCGFYGDTYNCHMREWFAPHLKHAADFYFAINEIEAQKAKTVFSSGTRRVATGNPTWEDYMFPKFTRTEVRAKYGVADDEILVLAPGGKSPVVNTIIWGLLIDALTVVSKSKLFISYHPGDRTPYAVDPDKGNVPLNIYADLKTFSSVPVVFLPNDVKTSHFLPGADVVVEWNSSIAIEAAHQRIPVISVATEVGKKRMFSTSKTEKWEPVELGVAKEVSSDSVALYDQISMLTGNKALADVLRRRQVEVYPKPQAKGEAVKKMADTLERVVRQGRCCG